MIKFDFTVDAEDAMNILSAVRDMAVKNDELAIRDMVDQSLSSEEREARLAWYKKNKAYVLGLLEKMTHERVS